MGFMATLNKQIENMFTCYWMEVVHVWTDHYAHLQMPDVSPAWVFASDIFPDYYFSTSDPGVGCYISNWYDH